MTSEMYQYFMVPLCAACPVPHAIVLCCSGGHITVCADTLLAGREIARETAMMPQQSPTTPQAIGNPSVRKRVGLGSGGRVSCCAAECYIVNNAEYNQFHKTTNKTSRSGGGSGSQPDR